VAPCSDADRNAVHVGMAHEAVCIGPAPAQDSYLRGDRILEVRPAPRLRWLLHSSTFYQRACIA